MTTLLAIYFMIVALPILMNTVLQAELGLAVVMKIRYRNLRADSLDSRQESSLKLCPHFFAMASDIHCRGGQRPPAR